MIEAFRGHEMISVKELGGGIIEVRIVNWRKYQKLHNYGDSGKEGKGRDDEGNGIEGKGTDHPPDSSANESDVISLPPSEPQFQVEGIEYRDVPEATAEVAKLGFGRSRAEAICRKTGIQPGEVALWRVFEQRHGTKAMMAAVQNYRTPAEVPPEVDRPGGGFGPKMNPEVLEARERMRLRRIAEAEEKHVD